MALINYAISIAELDWWKSSDHQHQPLNEVEEKWLKIQISFLSQRLESNLPKGANWEARLYKRPLRLHSKLSTYSRFFFNAGVIFGFLIGLVMFLQYFLQYHAFDGGKHYLMYGVQFSLMASGAIALWDELSGYKATANGYQNLLILYKRAQGFTEGEMTSEKQHMLIELAREAMYEHINWMHSESENDIKNK